MSGATDWSRLDSAALLLAVVYSGASRSRCASRESPRVDRVVRVVAGIKEENDLPEVVQ